MNKPGSNHSPGCPDGHVSRALCSALGLQPLSDSPQPKLPPSLTPPPLAHLLQGTLVMTPALEEVDGYWVGSGLGASSSTPHLCRPTSPPPPPPPPPPSGYLLNLESGMGTERSIAVGLHPMVVSSRVMGVLPVRI